MSTQHKKAGEPNAPRAKAVWGSKNTVDRATMHALEGRLLLAVDLITDVNARPVIPPGPADLTDLGGTLYFSADDGKNGQELWRSDGTAAGTSMVRDIQPGSVGSAITGLSALNGLLYFSANDGPSSGAEPWRSDGTAAGTYRLADLYPGFTSSSPAGFTALGTSTYFFAGGTAGVGLWRTDGTAAGTTLVKTLLPNTYTPPFGTPVVANGVMYFLNQSTGGAGLWASDGTAAGTRQLAAFGPFASGGLTWFNGALYFSLAGSQGYQDVYRSDGTTAPLVRVASPSSTSTGNLTVAGNRLYFTATTAAAGRELWSYDGSTAAIVKDLAPGSVWSNPSGLTAFNGRLLFTADDGTNGRELWNTDGTTAGTTLVDLRPGPAPANPIALSVANGAVYCFADSDAGPGLWAGNGTTAGSRRLRTFAEGGWPVPFHSVGSNVYFVAGDGATGPELWRTDGSAANTALVRDIFPLTGSSKPDLIASLGGRAYFFADDGYHGKELWVSDGTAAGTTLLREAVAGTSDRFTRGGGIATSKYVYYQQRAVTGGGYEICRTDGTAAGTGPMIDVGAPILYWAAAGDRAFAVTDTNRLWMTDAAGDNWREFDTAYLTGPMAVAANGIVYLTGSSRELWRSDGTVAGTYRVADINPAADDGITGLTAVGDEAFFFAQDANGAGNKLYKSDGTAAGTVLVKDVHPGGDDWVRSITRNDGTAVAGGRFFFSATDDLGYPELWTSDGTAAGTRPAVDPAVGSAGGGDYLVALGDVVISSTYYNGVWSLVRSDGTPAGTFVLAPAGMGSNIYPFVSASARVGDVLYVSATRADGSNAVWRTDGTIAGTWMVTDVDPGGAGLGNQGQLLPVGADGVLVVADDKVHGLEPYRVTPEPPLLVSGAGFVPGAGAGAGLMLTFGRALTGAPTAAQLVVKNLTTGATVPAANVRVVQGDDGATVSVAFPGYPGGVLPDGNYRVTLTAGAVHDTAGNPLGRDFAFDFFALAGDVNRDRAVNFDDLLVLAKNYNGTNKTWADGDLTGDGVVNFDDLLILAKAYNNALAAPAPVVAVAPASAAVTGSAVLVDESKGKPVFSTARVARPVPKTAPVKAKGKAKGR